MTRPIFFLYAMTALMLVTSSVASAEMVSYKFAFTGADLMNYVAVDGADDSSPADNGLYDGARLVRQNLEPGYTHTRSYVASQNGAFANWADNTTDRFLGFNLWGFDGRGAGWGDDYKPESWGAMTQSSGWTNWTTAWPWGTPPAGYNTDLLIGWDADSFEDGVNFSDADLASKEFSFVVNFDTTDMFWNEITHDQPGDAPNSLPELTFWFGGWFDNDYWGAENDYYMYEGNLVLTGTQIPAPGAALLGVIGLSAIAWLRRRF